MKRRWAIVASCALVSAVILAGCTWLSPTNVGPRLVVTGENYILAFGGLPQDVEATIADYGGTVRAVLEEIDAVLVTGDAEFLVAIEGVEGFIVAIPDAAVDWLPGIEHVELGVEHIGEDEPFFAAYQWDMMAIEAPGAWDAGYTGAGVRVAVLDTGIDVIHPDLAPNLNVALSTSFVPYEPFIDDLNGHGSNVSGIVAAAHNGIGVIGVAPNAEIVAIKVLDGAGSGDFSWLLEAILYAVSIDVDIVNMSLGAYMSHNGYVRTPSGDLYIGAEEVAGFANLVKKTINFAEQQGVFLAASAGNDSHDGTGDSGWMHLPSDVGGMAVVSATGPIGWAYSHDVDLDQFAFYSDYGAQIDFAAPGGNADFNLPLWYWDLVMNCSNGQWYAWFGGTSQAAPHVCGVAALIIEKNGGDMDPPHVLRELRHSADDLGKPGRDPYYGYGRVNASNAVAP